MNLPSFVYMGIGLLLAVVVSVGIMVWSVNSPYLTARWKGCGSHVFIFSLLFLFVAGLLESLLTAAISTRPSTVGTIALFSFFVGIVEECGKLLAVVIGTSRLRRVMSPLDLFSYGALSAGAFSMLENVLYALISDFHWGMALARSVLSTPVHICCTTVAILGVLRWAETGKRRYIPLHTALAISIHALYDLILLLDVSNLLLLVMFCAVLLPLMIACIVLALCAPARYAKSHSSAFCPRCGAQFDLPLLRCARCGNPGVLKIVHLPRLTHQKKEVSHEP